jgi:hypothetical protein
LRNRAGFPVDNSIDFLLSRLTPDDSFPLADNHLVCKVACAFGSTHAGRNGSLPGSTSCGLRWWKKMLLHSSSTITAPDRAGRLPTAAAQYRNCTWGAAVFHYMHSEVCPLTHRTSVSGSVEHALCISRDASNYALERWHNLKRGKDHGCWSTYAHTQTHNWHRKREEKPSDCWCSGRGQSLDMSRRAYQKFDKKRSAQILW